jgi:hypothetical protein
VNTAATLPLNLLFSIANGATLLAWVMLIALPRWVLLRRAIQVAVVLSLCMLYTVLIQLYFFGVQGGGFFSLAAVQQLFTSPAVALAGWVHYLAFDLFVGLWIAQRADNMALSRWLQAPLLAITFMFGPIGLLLFAAALAVHGRRLLGGGTNIGSGA